MAQTQPYLTTLQLQRARGLDDWRGLGRGAAAWFAAPDHRAGAELVRVVAERASDAGLPVPDMDLRQQGLQVRLAQTQEGFSPDTVALARAVSKAALELGLRADPTVLMNMQLTFDAMDHRAVPPFWEAALGYAQEGDECLVDPDRRRPPIWFQQQDAPRPHRNRMHLDSVAPRPVSVAALEAAQARGARTVDHHGYYATVADSEGNEVDLLELEDWDHPWSEPGTEDWRLVFAAMACYPTMSDARSVQLVETVAGLADDAGLPLGIDLRPGLVTLDTGKDRWEMEVGYESLAAQAQDAARRLGLTADVDRPRFLQVGIDAVDIPAVRTFWRAVLGYVEDPRPGVTDIVDPRQLNMSFFIQRLDASDGARRAQRNRIHIDLFVPDDQAQTRIDAGLATGGRVVYDAEAPEWWTLADPEGNEVDIAVSAGREEAWQASTAT